MSRKAVRAAVMAVRAATQSRSATWHSPSRFSAHAAISRWPELWATASASSTYGMVRSIPAAPPWAAAQRSCARRRRKTLSQCESSPASARAMPLSITVAPSARSASRMSATTRWSVQWNHCPGEHRRALTDTQMVRSSPGSGLSPDSIRSRWTQPAPMSRSSASGAAFLWSISRNVRNQVNASRMGPRCIQNAANSVTRVSPDTESARSAKAANTVRIVGRSASTRSSQRRSCVEASPLPARPAKSRHQVSNLSRAASASPDISSSSTA